MIDQLLISLFLTVLSIARVQGANHIVNVGNGGFRYDPNVTHAAAGDVVTFRFFPTNHSVYRAVYTENPDCPGGYCNPCVPSNIYFPAREDFFFSTLLLGDVSNPQEWNLTINDTKPVFFACNAPGSCQPNGMVGVINPNASTSIDKQMAAAVAAQYQLSPGDEFPSEAAPTAPTNTPSPSPASSTDNNGGSGHHGLSGGAIAGIVVGSVAAVTVIAALVFYYSKSRAYTHIFSASQGKGGDGSGFGTSSVPPGSDAGGGGGGGNVGAWVASQQREKVGMDAEAQHQRGSYQYASVSGGSSMPGSPSPEQGAQFVGYNRTSGGAEYAFEAPGIDHQISEMRTGGAGLAPGQQQQPWSGEKKNTDPSGHQGRVELP